MPPQPHNEQSLLRRVSHGEEKAFEELVIRYSGLLYSFIYKHTKNHELTQEIVQDVFIQIWQSKESLSELRSFGNFLYVMSRNHAVNAVRKYIREREYYQELVKNGAIAADDDLAKDLKEQQLNLIDEAIAHLPPQQQKVWIMSRRQGKKYQEIADELGLSKETVKKYLQHATNSIIQYVSQHASIYLLLLLGIKI